MCKSTTYTLKQQGILNFQWNLVSIPWLVLGMTMVALLWLLLTMNKHCKRRKQRQALSDRNIELQNHKMSTTPFFAQAFSQFAPPALTPPFSQPAPPFSQPPFSQTGSEISHSRVPAYEEFHPLTLKLNTPLV